jgi:hypothetical protein
MKHEVFRALAYCRARKFPLQGKMSNSKISPISSCTGVSLIMIALIDGELYEAMRTLLNAEAEVPFNYDFRR